MEKYEEEKRMERENEVRGREGRKEGSKARNEK